MAAEQATKCKKRSRARSCRSRWGGEVEADTFNNYYVASRS